MTVSREWAIQLRRVLREIAACRPGRTENEIEDFSRRAFEDLVGKIQAARANGEGA